MKRETLKRQYIGELEGMKKAKQFIYRNQVQNRKTEEAKNTAIKINLIGEYVDRFSDFIDRCNETIEIEKFEKEFYSLLEMDFKKFEKLNKDLLSSKDYASSLNATLCMEQIEEMMVHFKKYLKLIGEI